MPFLLNWTVNLRNHFGRIWEIFLQQLFFWEKNFTEIWENSIFLILGSKYVPKSFGSFWEIFFWAFCGYSISLSISISISPLFHHFSPKSILAPRTTVEIGKKTSYGIRCSSHPHQLVNSAFVNYATIRYHSPISLNTT